VRIFYDNLIDLSATVITAGSEAADLPASNVQHPHRGKVYRTGVSAAAEWIKFDLGSAQAVQAVILLDHTLTASDTTIKLQGNATDSWGSPSVDETITFNAGTMVLYLSAEQTYRWWRVIFTKSAAGETRDIGRVFLGPYVECTQSFRYGDAEIKPVDLSETDRALGGQTFSEIKPIYNEIKGSFYWIDDTQATLLKSLSDTVGTHTPFFLSIDPTNKGYDLLYYGKFKQLSAQKIEHTYGGYKWSVGFEMAEEA